MLVMALARMEGPATGALWGRIGAAEQARNARPGGTFAALPWIISHWISRCELHSDVPRAHASSSSSRPACDRGLHVLSAAARQ